ncbi:S8 family serine peptidase [Haladaptatus sp. GCM10025893]|uniref:S8 family serine peptidase n=1 Tax=Haladaptatus sp. GCM10025893 TaxID=3252659 RepID=UPI003617D240
MPYEPAFVNEEKSSLATIEDIRQVHSIPRNGSTGDGVTVVVLDSGVDPSHPVFDETAMREVDVTEEGGGDAIGHGTAVCGQLARLAPNADLVSLRIFGQRGRTRTDTVLRAYEWLHKNRSAYDVVVMSWGTERRSPALDRIHEHLLDAGIRDVVAAGSSAARNGSPATAKRTLSVGACTMDSERASFSATTPGRDNPDVLAIGVDARLAQAGRTKMGIDLAGQWVKASGTSVAAPTVAGLAARYLERFPEATPETLKRDFEAATTAKTEGGAGVIDYRETVAQAIRRAG